MSLQMNEQRHIAHGPDDDDDSSRGPSLDILKDTNHNCQGYFNTYDS